MRTLHSSSLINFNKIMGRNEQQNKRKTMLFRSLKLVFLTALLSRSVGLPDVLTFVFSWQGYQLCIRTKYRGTEQFDFIFFLFI